MVAWLVVVALALSGGDPGAIEGAASGSPQRRFHEIEADMQTALRREATAKTLTDKAPAIRELVQLHRELVRDSRYPLSDTLQEYRGKIAVRLFSVRNDLKRKLARQASSPRSKNASGSNAAPTANAIPAEMENVLSTNLALVATTLGGPVQALTREGGAAGGGMQDDGWVLVDLIETTINPKFWDTNGGPGSVYYFAPLRCIVVRGTSEMHDNVGGLVEQLRDAGR